MGSQTPPDRWRGQGRTPCTLARAESYFPPGLAVSQTRPQWVVDEGLVGFVQWVNQGTADIYLLFAFELGSTADALTDGQPVDSSIWSRGLVLKPGDTFDIVGEGNMMQFAPGMRPINVNNPDGSARPPLLLLVIGASAYVWHRRRVR